MRLFVFNFSFIIVHEALVLGSELHGVILTFFAVYKLQINVAALNCSSP